MSPGPRIKWVTGLIEHIVHFAFSKPFLCSTVGKFLFLRRSWMSTWHFHRGNVLDVLWEHLRSCGISSVMRIIGLPFLRSSVYSC